MPAGMRSSMPKVHAQDDGSRHCRQADRSRLSLQYAACWHLQARRKRLRFRSGESLIFTDTDRRAPAEFGASFFLELKCETGAAAARGFCLRIFHLERGADQVVDKIDFRSGHVVD